MSLEKLLSLRARAAARLLAVCCLVIGASIGASASLGDSSASIAADHAQLRGTLRVRHQAECDVHEMVAAGGVVLREYVAPNGMVFAVSWQGPAVPDMKQALGIYFERFLDAQRRIPRGALILREPGLVLEMSGHMRSFSGRAYVPEMMPKGVRAADVQ